MTTENKPTSPVVEPVQPKVLTPEEQVAHLENLKQEAQLMGIQYSGNIGAEALAQKIEERRKEIKLKQQAANVEIEEKAKGEMFEKTSTEQMMNAELAVAERRRHAKQLHRVIVTCHDPSKAKLQGRIFTVGNSAFGSETKYIAYNQPWHVSTMMLNAIKEKQYLAHFTTKDPRTGREVTKHRLVPEFSIQTLPPLSNDELRVLAEQQKLRDSGDSAK